MTSLSRTAERTLAVETALKLLVGACGFLCFLIVQDGIGWGTALIFGAVLLIWPLANFICRKINLTQNQNRDQNNIVNVKFYFVFFNENIN